MGTEYILVCMKCSVKCDFEGRKNFSPEYFSEKEIEKIFSFVRNHSPPDYHSIGLVDDSCVEVFREKVYECRTCLPGGE